MKREGYLYEKICSIDNLILADKIARRGKSKQKSIKLFDENKQDNLIDLHHLLVNKEYKTSEYKIFIIFEKKERVIFQLPYRDRVVHWAIINILEEIFVKSFTIDTYSCIKKRGIHKCLNNLTIALKDVKNTEYCLKLDIKKYYPSIKNNILKQLLRKKFKDPDLLDLLDEIIDSNIGQPIGNLLSQWFGNFYLTYFDHYLKEMLKIKNVFRYCDDIVILGSNKDDLRIILNKIKIYLKNNLELELSNHQIFPIESRGIDFLGYVSYHYSEIYIRKEIKLAYIKMCKYYPNNKSKVSYKGWLNHANCINLKNKYENEIRTKR